MQGVNWLGPHGHVLHYPVRRGEIMNFISFVERDDWQVESWVTQGTHDELANDFRGWHADVHEIISRIETPVQMGADGARPDAALEQGPRHAARRRLPSDPAVPRPGRRHGDRGRLYRRACLAKYFDDPATAFARYEEIRRERTATVVRKAHENRRSAFSPALADRARWRPKSRANGSRSACASGWNGSTPMTPRRSRCSANLGTWAGGASRHAKIAAKLVS